MSEKPTTEWPKDVADAIESMDRDRGRAELEESAVSLHRHATPWLKANSDAMVGSWVRPGSSPVLALGQHAAGLKGHKRSARARRRVKNRLASASRKANR